MESNDLTRRLRRLGDAPIDPAVAIRHVAALRSVEPRSGAPWGRIAVVAASVVALAGPAAALTVAVAGDHGQPTEIAPAQVPGEAESEVFSCTGPPPFAGEVPEGDTEEEQAAAREAEAAAFETWRDANCPTEDNGGDSRPATGGDCAGRPPFADAPAEPAVPAEGVIPSPRSDEARALAESRSGCGDGEGGADDLVTGGDGEVPGTSGPPEGTPTGPPDGTPTGPPDGTPTGPPDGTPTGPPDATPNGPPEGLPGPTAG